MQVLGKDGLLFWLLPLRKEVVGGFRTSLILEVYSLCMKLQFDSRFRQKDVTLQPDVVIIGLSLLNEGILWGRKEDVCDSFRKGMQILIQMIKDCGAIPILGGLYPHFHILLFNILLMISLTFP